MPSCPTPSPINSYCCSPYGSDRTLGPCLLLLLPSSTPVPHSYPPHTHTTPFFAARTETRIHLLFSVTGRCACAVMLKKNVVSISILLFGDRAQSLVPPFSGCLCLPLLFFWRLYLYTVVVPLCVCQTIGRAPPSTASRCSRSNC